MFGSLINHGLISRKAELTDRADSSTSSSPKGRGNVLNGGSNKQNRLPSYSSDGWIKSLIPSLILVLIAPLRGRSSPASQLVTAKHERGSKSLRSLSLPL